MRLRVWSVVVAGVLVLPVGGVGAAQGAVPPAPVPGPGVLASPVVAPPACPPTSSLCNPEGLAVLAALEGVVVTTAVTTAGLTAGSLIVGSGSSDGPGAGGLAQPQVQEGWAPSSIVNRQPNLMRPVWQQYLGSTAQTVFTVVQPPEWGATSGTIAVDWQVGWGGAWTAWNESGQVGLQVKCRNGSTWGSTSDVGASRGQVPGGPGTVGYVGSGSFQPVVASSLCPEPRGGLDRIEAVDGYDGTVLATYYPPGHPERPAAASLGRGTVTRWLDCVDPSGEHTKIYDYWTGDVATGGTYQLPEMVCPPGSTPAQFGSDWTPASDPSVKQVVVPATSAPDWMIALPGDFPECFTSGASCRMGLFDWTGATIQSCGIFAVDCPFWYVDPLRAAHYECRWGPYEVDLSYCSMFRDPGRILPNTFTDVNGIARFGGFVDLALDSWVVGSLVGRLTDRYTSDQARCEALGEAVRDARTVLTERVNIPDVVWDCTEHGIDDALYYVTVTGGDLALAVAALAAAAIFSPPPTTTRPDCDQVANGTCTDPKLSVSIGTQEWATGPKGGPSSDKAATALQTCSDLVQAANPAWTPTQAQHECESKPIFVPGGRAGAGKEAAAHDLDVITAHPTLVQLHYISDSNNPKPPQWYRSGSYYLPPCTGEVEKRKTECDEYPYYSSVEGGRAAYDTYGQKVIAPVNWTDNRKEGAALSRMYRDPRCGMTSATAASPGSSYLVVPLPQRHH